GEQSRWVATKRPPLSIDIVNISRSVYRWNPSRVRLRPGMNECNFVIAACGWLSRSEVRYLLTGHAFRLVTRSYRSRHSVDESVCVGPRDDLHVGGRSERRHPRFASLLLRPLFRSR